MVHDEIVQQILKYLGCPPNTPVEGSLLDQINKALLEVKEHSRFQYIYKHCHDFLNFMNAHDAYLQYISGAEGFLLCATTLGIQIDRLLKRHQTTDMSYAVILDAAASAYLEHCADTYEETLPFENKGFRFCPGYGGTSLEDNKHIAEQLHPERIGITFLSSGLMVPQKSMMGIIRLGGNSRKTCTGCVTGQNCTYRRGGTTCYHS